MPPTWPTVGALTLGFQGMQLEGTPGQRLGIYLAQVGTPDYDAMILLDMTALAVAESQPHKSGTVAQRGQAGRPSGLSYETSCWGVLTGSDIS
jgi:hypothetical protein